MGNYKKLKDENGCTVYIRPHTEETCLHWELRCRDMMHVLHTVRIILILTDEKGGCVLYYMTQGGHTIRELRTSKRIMELETLLPSLLVRVNQGCMLNAWADVSLSEHTYMQLDLLPGVNVAVKEAVFKELVPHLTVLRGQWPCPF